MIDSHIANCETDQKPISTTKKVPLTQMINRKIVLTLDSANLGGIETHVYTLASYLQTKGNQIEIWFVRRYQHNPLYKMLDQQQINYHFCNSTKDYWNKIRQAKDEIILHTHGYKAGILARIIAKLHNIPVISTFHSGDLGRGKLRVYSQIDLWTARLGHSIAVSEVIKGWLPKSAQLIPNFVEVPNVKPYRNSSNKPLQVAFVGRLSHEKGPDLFCRLAKLWHQCPKRQEHEREVNFVMYGDGPDRSTLIDQHNSFVQFKGHVKMQDYWQNVDLLCISSRFEGLPYVALEAMSLGIPVVTFDVGGLKSLIDKPDLGWVVESGNMKALKNAVEQWHQQSIEQREQQSQIVKDKIQQHYSTEALIPKIEQLYVDAVNDT